MNSTKRVIFLTVGAVALETFAGVALASELVEVVGKTMETLLGILGTALFICLLIIGTGVMGVRKLLKIVQAETSSPTVSRFIEMLKSDTDKLTPEGQKRLDEVIRGQQQLDRQMKVLIEQYAMEKAAEAGPRAGRPYLGDHPRE